MNAASAAIGLLLSALLWVTPGAAVASVASDTLEDPEGQEAPRPNIVLIYADDLGYGDLAIYGHHTLHTPNLDRLASQGLRFTNFYAPSALCSPSRAGLLTGRVPVRTGIETWIPPDTDVQLGPREVTLATLLKGVGYETFLGGKWHLNGGLHREDQTQPGDHGFDHWLALHGWPIPHNMNPTNFYRNGEPLGEVRGHTARIVVDEAKSWLDRWREGRAGSPESGAGEEAGQGPFFMYLAMIEPHSTLANPDFFNELYDRYTIGEPDPFPNAEEVPDNLAARGPGEYYANITFMDYQLGRFFEYLDREGLAEETLVVFASDNGPVTTAWRHWYEVNLYGSTGGLRGRKADLYEGGIRVPAIVRWPGRVEPGSVSDAVVSAYDLLPTVAEVAGFAVPDDRPIDGESVGAVLRGEDFERERPLYWEFEDDRGFYFALRDGCWKLLADEELETVELYDLCTYSFEVVDRAEENPDVVDALLGKVRELHADVSADPLRPDRRATGGALPRPAPTPRPTPTPAPAPAGQEP